MGQPTPPGDNVPLYDGLDASWNDVVSAFPEDRRAELAGSLKSRIDSYEPLKKWEDFSKSGIEPDHAKMALDVYSTIETNPKYVYDTLAKHLGISPQQAKEVVEEVQDAAEADPTNTKIQQLEQQLNTLIQIQLAERQQQSQASQAAEADKQLENDLNGLKKKYGDVNEREIVMRMMHLDMTPEEAYQDYTNMVSEIRKTRPSPMLLNGGGGVPSRALDPTKLSGKDTRNIVAQMLDNANTER